jgi:hypothetical protein
LVDGKPKATASNVLSPQGDLGRSKGLELSLQEVKPDLRGAQSFDPSAKQRTWPSASVEVLVMRPEPDALKLIPFSIEPAAD